MFVIFSVEEAPYLTLNMREISAEFLEERFGIDRLESIDAGKVRSLLSEMQKFPDGIPISHSESYIRIQAGN